MIVRAYALLLGILCHGLFVLGVGLMMYSLYFGLQLGLPLFEGKSRILWNLFLVFQFPLLHSFFLSKKGQSLFRKLSPEHLGGALNTTFFGILASFQLVLVFGTWQGSSVIWWIPSGTWLYVLSLGYALAWLALLKAMIEAGLGLQTGFSGWYAVFRGRKPKFKSFPRKGMHGVCRHPIYFSYAAMLWLAPVWSLDRIVLALIWTAYCLVGPLFKEQRYLRYAGTEYRKYQKLVPYWIRISAFRNAKQS